jgi:hypothetical protein
MLSEMSAGEYLDWVRHFRDHPFDYHLEQFGIGQICASVYNCILKPEQPIPLTQFYINPPEPAEMTDDEMASAGLGIAGGVRIERSTDSGHADPAECGQGDI